MVFSVTFIFVLSCFLFLFLYILKYVKTILVNWAIQTLGKNQSIAVDGWPLHSMILKRSWNNNLRISTQDQCTKRNPQKCVSGAAITMCYYFVQISTTVVPHFFQVAMRHFFVDCLATIAKQFVLFAFFGQVLKNRTMIMCTMNCKVILASSVKGTMQWHCMLMPWFIQIPRLLIE